MGTTVTATSNQVTVSVATPGPQGPAGTGGSGRLVLLDSGDLGVGAADLTVDGLFDNSYDELLIELRCIRPKVGEGRIDAPTFSWREAGSGVLSGAFGNTKEDWLSGSANAGDFGGAWLSSGDDLDDEARMDLDLHVYNFTGADDIRNPVVMRVVGTNTLSRTPLIDTAVIVTGVYLVYEAGRIPFDGFRLAGNPTSPSSSDEFECHWRAYGVEVT